MRQLAPQSRIFLVIQPVDFRKGIDSLAAVCRQILGQQPLSGAVFVFRNRSATALTILFSDGQGCWLCLKRLSQGRCTWWPTSAQTQGPLCARALLMLLWNGTPERAARATDWRKVAEGGASLAWDVHGHHAAGVKHTSERCSCQATRSSTALTPACTPGAIRLVSTLATEALCSVLSNSACCR